jgi:hypothetical protein
LIVFHRSIQHIYITAQHSTQHIYITNMVHPKAHKNGHKTMAIAPHVSSRPNRTSQANTLHFVTDKPSNLNKSCLPRLPDCFFGA